jgi:hypothetical protein
MEATHRQPKRRLYRGDHIVFMAHEHGRAPYPVAAIYVGKVRASKAIATGTVSVLVNNREHLLGPKVAATITHASTEV